MINVLHIVLGLQVGGLEKFVLDLIDKYPPNIKPYIVCLEKKGELGRHFENLDIIELNKSPSLSFKTVMQLVSMITKLDIDIIHTHNPGPHFYGAIAGFLARKPVIHTKHGRNYPADGKKVWLNKISSYFTDKVVAVSQNAADVCLEVENINSSKLEVILNGIDTNIFAPRKCEAEDNKPVQIGIVARLSAEKDHQTLLGACKLLSTQKADFHLDIIGDGPLRGVLESSVKSLEIDKYVSFCGTRHDVPELLRKLDIFVLSSISEGISLTLLEAMATRLPIVATNVGGNPEVVVDCETGYIVPPGNPEEMANKLLLLIKDENLRIQMGEKGRERVVMKFSIDETAQQYEKLYYSVLKRN